MRRLEIMESGQVESSLVKWYEITHDWNVCIAIPISNTTVHYL